MFKLLLKIPYIKNNVISLLRACVSETWCNNGFNIDKAQSKFNDFLIKRKLL